MSSEQVDREQDPDALVVEDELADIDERLEVAPSRYSITSYGADYPVDGLVQRLEKRSIFVPSFDPETTTASGIVGFQRDYVWTKSQADRFIESLLLGLPVPGIFLVSEPDNTLLVLDGQQRLRSLQAFYAGVIRGKEFRLQYVEEQFKGLSYKDLAPELQRMLDDSIIHATIVRQDEPSEDQSAIYSIFERLNTGGTLLQPQEIRVALYHGELVRLLRKLNEDPNWRALYGNRSNRLKDQEMILRFLSFFERAAEYKRPMKDFLNQFMAKYRNPSSADADRFGAVFKKTVGLVHDSVGPRAFRIGNTANAAVIDSLMVAIAERVTAGDFPSDASGLKEAYERLMDDEDYRDAVERATADEENVRVRLEKARAAVASVS
jgi:hypothetical protein